MTRFLILCAIGFSLTSMWSQEVAQSKGQEFSGTWFGDIVITHPDGSASHGTDVLVAEQHGASLTGSTGGTVDQLKIFTDGRVDGNSMRFHMDAQGGMDFNLRLDNGHLIGVATGKSMKAEVNLQRAPGLLPHQKLVEEITEADQSMFKAFEACDVKRYASFVSTDLEFYHDHTGKSGYERDLKALQNRCTEGIVLRRELVEDSLVINSIPGYGAVEAGIHRFYSRQRDGSEHLDATARFTMVWSKETGSWKLVRIISYDHR